MNPQFLILDEPTAGQDPAGVELMAEVIRASRAAGKGVLAITHDMDFCAENFERLIVLKQGRLVFDGEMGAALVNPGVFREAGLGEPQVQQVGRALALEGPMPTMDAFLEAYRAWKTL
jgi:energy-coupling factor transport system ATP-binding protein